MIWSPPYPDDACSGKRGGVGVDLLTSALRRRAQELGFIGIGFSRPERLSHFDRFAAWLSKGHHAGMAWLGKNIALREDPSKLLPNCRRIISLAYPYSPRRPS